MIVEVAKVEVPDTPSVCAENAVAEVVARVDVPLTLKRLVIVVEARLADDVV